MSEENDLLELKMQLEHNIDNADKRIDILKTEGAFTVEKRRKWIVQLAKITDETVEDTESNQSWIKPEST